MTIGLPKALLYYRYHVLWENFFHRLGFKTVTSGETNKKILEDGIQYSIDECCLPFKVYMGHVYSLIGKCDYILVPRVVNYGEKNIVCTKFNALYDNVRNTFSNAPLLHYNIEVKRGFTEQAGFLQMGMALGKDPLKTLMAYRAAKRAQEQHNLQQARLQDEILNTSDKLKILIVSHPYNTYDKLIGEPLTRYIQSLGGTAVYADRTDKASCIRESTKLSQSLYWLYNKELIGSVRLLEKKIDGVILLTAFPCGPDSLVNELMIRKIKDLPVINIVLDELQGEAGLQTRIESFMDILRERLKRQAS